MGKQRKELIFGRICVNQFLAQCHVAGFVLEKIKHALNSLLRALQAKQADVHKMRDACFVLERLLDQLKRCSKGEDFLDRFGRGNLNIAVGCFNNVAPGRRISETLRHLGKSLVGLKKTSRNRIDKSNATRHVGENFFIENNFAFDTPCGFDLAPVELACAPRANGCADQQPADKDVHLVQQIMHRFIGDGLGLRHHCHPAGRFHRAKRIKIAVPLKMAGLVRLDIVHQRPGFPRLGA